MLEKVAVSPEEEDIIDEALHLLEGYTDPPYPILAAYWGNLSGKHKPKALYLLQGQDRELSAKQEKEQKSDMESMKRVFLLYPDMGKAPQSSCIRRIMTREHLQEKNL